MKLKAKKSLVCAGVMAVAAGAIITTFAVTRDSAVMNNVFNIAKYETQFVEEFESPSNWSTCETVDKTIQVKNNTDTDIVARVKLEEEWNDKNNLGLPLVSNGSGERMAIVNLADNSGWTLDGTYYYSPTLAPGATSTSVISGVTLNCDANLDEDYRYGNAEYKLSAKVETIQADRASTEWHKISVLKPLPIVLSNAYGISAKVRSMKFLEADSLGINVEEITDDRNIISDPDAADSNTPAYMWYDADENTVYWYSDADDVYATSKSQWSAPTGFSYFTDISGLYNLNTSRITYLDAAFESYGGTSLHGLEKWDVSNVTNMHDLLYRSKVVDISALSRWDVSSVSTFGYMFEGSPLSDVSPLAGWNLASATTLNAAFRGTNIDGSICSLADWNVSSIDEHRVGNRYYEAFKSSNNSNIDATCLDAWNVDISGGKYSTVFNNNWTKPYWAY